MPGLHAQFTDKRLAVLTDLCWGFLGVYILFDF